MTPTKNPVPSDEETAALLEPEDDEPTKPYVYRVPEKTAAYNRALLGEHKRRVNPDRIATEEIQEEEKVLEDWPGQLRKGTLALGFTAFLVAASPIALVIIWALSQ